MAAETAPRTRPYTGAEYLESLRDGREIWIYGERVKDVTTHPAFRNTARMIARLFHDALYGPDAWAAKFRRVVFAVFDPSDRGENRVPFEETFEAARGAP